MGDFLSIYKRFFLYILIFLFCSIEAFSVFFFSHLKRFSFGVPSIMRTTDALISPLCKLSYNVVFINVVFLCFFFSLLLSKLSCLSVDLLSFSLFFFFLLPADRKSVRGKTHRHDSNVWHTTLRSVQNVRELPFF